MVEIDPGDLELLYPIGRFSLQEVAAAYTLTFPSSAEGGSTARPSPAAERQREAAAGDAACCVNVYAARRTSTLAGGGDGDGRVVLKEFQPGVRELALAELLVYRRLEETKQWAAPGGESSTAPAPVLPLLGVFEAAGPGDSDEAAALAGESEDEER